MTCSICTIMQANMVYRNPVPWISPYSSDFIFSSLLAYDGYQILFPEFGKYCNQIRHFKVDNTFQETEALIIRISHILPKFFFMIVDNNDHLHVSDFNEPSPRGTFIAADKGSDLF